MTDNNTANRTTRHTHPVVFGRRQAGCPRCVELANGAAPVRWAARKEVRHDDIRAHRCSAKCGPVCTYGDY